MSTVVGPRVLVWMDVLSTDIARSLSFYAGLFGWTSEVLPADHGDGYHLLRSGRHLVAGAEQVDPRRELPLVWTVMVEADDARTVLDTAVAAGGEETFVLSPMQDLGDIAMLLDPWGATVGVWRPEHFRPSWTPAVPGRLVGAVLETPEPAASAAYYLDVFGWQATRRGRPEDGFAAGVPVVVAPGDGPARWTPVLDGTGADPRVIERNAAPDERVTVPGARLVSDPMGATFYVRAPDPHARPR